MKLEREGWEMYRRFRDAASGADREFFSRLLEQEIKHLESLQNVHYYLTGTGDWLGGEESRIWNWMNT